VLISSSSVFGSANIGARSESDPKNPISPYAVSKLAMELASQVNRLNYSQNSLVIRLFNVFGPLQRSDHDYAAVIPKWISAAIDGKPLNIFGDGTQSRDFTFVNDVVEILISCLYRPELFNIPELNVGFGRPVELNEIVRILRKDFKNLYTEKLQARVGDISRSLNDTTLFHSLFTDFQPTPIEQAIKETIEWFER
jgi:UDP-glucose 4-epimerase